MWYAEELRPVDRGADEGEDVEFERKFLVRGSAYREFICANRLVQGYLSTDVDRTVRVDDDKSAALTIKGRSSSLQWDDGDAGPLDELLGAAVTYRIAVGLQRGQKAFTRQTLPPAPVDEEEQDNVARTGGFSLHAGIAAKPFQRAKLERL